MLLSLSNEVIDFQWNTRNMHFKTAVLAKGGLTEFSIGGSGLAFGNF